jgi:hypothetical protein
VSWSFSIPPTDQEHFDAAVDRAEAGGQDLSLPGVRDDISTAKYALKDLGRRVKRAVLAGQASGHALQADEGSGMHDGVSVSVYGVAKEHRA